MELRTLDHPEANGRRRLPGDASYYVDVQLEGGEMLRLFMGQRSFEDLAKLILCYRVDQHFGTPLEDEIEKHRLPKGDNHE